MRRRGSLALVLRRLASAFWLRRLVGELHAIGEALAAQNAQLLRLADHFAPRPPVVDRDALRHDASITHLDPIEAGLALDYIARTHHDTGHTPDDEEILIYLADEKTTDLHKRLAARDDELQRLAEARR